MNKINLKEINQRMSHALTDGDLIKYFGKSYRKYIMTYSDLSKYNTINQLLPKDKSFIIILIEFKENNGHWVSLSRDGDTIVYFNSYGGTDGFPSSELNLLSHSKRIELDQYYKYLNILLTKALKKYKVIFNKVQFQIYDQNIATCGRHVCFHLLMFKYYNMSLKQYIDFMKKLKRYMKLSYDQIVTYFIE